MTARRYLRAADMARLTGVSVRTVRRWIADEVVPSVKIGGTRLVDWETVRKAAFSSFENDASENDEFHEDTDGYDGIGNKLPK